MISLAIPLSPPRQEPYLGLENSFLWASARFVVQLRWCSCLFHNTKLAQASPSPKAAPMGIASWVSSTSLHKRYIHFEGGRMHVFERNKERTIPSPHLPSSPDSQFSDLQPPTLGTLAPPLGCFASGVTKLQGEGLVEVCDGW